MDEENLDLNSL